MIKLFPHQKQALDRTKDLNRVAFFHDMGLGKTYTGSEKMMQLGSKVNLVVCQKSKVDDWVEHFKENYAAWVIVFDLSKPKEFKEFIDVVIVRKFQSMHFTTIIIGVINYDLLFRRPSLKQLENFTLMLDESSLIQNEKAKRSKFILNLNPSNVILLSGTPTSGKYENLWSQIHLLGWNISQDTYNKQYVNWKKINIGGLIHKVVNKNDPYKNVDRLKMKMREHGCDFIKTEDVFNLPEQTFNKVMVKTSKEYRIFEKNSIVQVHTGVFDHECGSEWDGRIYDDLHELVGDTTLSKMIYLRMLCGQYNKDKLQAFKDLVESTQDRLIVFYNFNEELNQLKKIAFELNRPTSEVNGHKKDLLSYEFNDNSITFCQYQAASMGLNLQKANKIIYFTLPLLSEHFEQSKKRIHRIGQTKPCFYYMMICNGSIEEEILQTLEMRKDYTDYLFEEGNKNE